MNEPSPRYLDGITSRPKTVRLSLTNDSLTILDGNAPVAVWPYSQIFVKEDWVSPAGAILGNKDNPDAGLSIYHFSEFQQIQKKLPRGHQASFIIPTQYRHLFLMAMCAVAACILVFPAMAYLATFTTYLIPPALEQKFGEQILSDMGREFEPCDDKVAVKNLQNIADRLVEATGQKDLKPEIHLFYSTTPNAFSLPGQKIAVLSQFLNDAKSENEIAAVMAHEMGHMVKRDSLEAFVEAHGVHIVSTLIGSSGSYGNVAEFASFMQSMNYSRKKEFLADEYGAKLLLKAGYSPKGLSAFLSRMDKENIGGLNDVMKYVEFLSTHPDTKERVRRIQALGGENQFKPILSAAEFEQLKNACRSKADIKPAPKT